LRGGLLRGLPFSISLTIFSKHPRNVARARAVLSCLALRPNRMKMTEVADFLNVPQSAISKCLLSGQKAVKENNKIIDQILK
jgi:hypothetical protein